MRTMRIFLATVASAFILSMAGAHAQVPQVINYQGQLTNASGSPLNGAHTIVFGIYDALTGGTLLWDETHSVNISADANGLFNVLLGNGTPAEPIPLNLFDSGTERYLQLTVDGSVLSPRQQLGSVPYAFRSQGAGGETLRLIRGYVQGATGAILGGSGFTVARGSTGSYSISFDTAFSDVPSITVTPISTLAVLATADASFGGTAVTVRIFNLTGAAADRNFFFIAVGPP